MGQTIGLVERTARKAHRCEWCAPGIQPGEKYQAWMWKDGADVGFLKVHSVCFTALNNIRDLDPWNSDDEFPCQGDWHETGRGCHDCDPENTTGWTDKNAAAT